MTTRHKGLGRGLDALLGGTPRTRGEEELAQLPIGVLRPGKYQPRTRMDEGSLAELADLAEALLGRLHFPRVAIERVVVLVRNHMFSYEPGWSDTAVRRMIGRIGEPALDELLDLRAADNLGSGLPADAGGLDELRARIAEQIKAKAVLNRSGLAIDGDDLMAELGASQGPILGSILDRLVEVVLNDPASNDRPTLLLLAQALLAEDG